MRGRTGSWNLERSPPGQGRGTLLGLAGRGRWRIRCRTLALALMMLGMVDVGAATRGDAPRGVPAAPLELVAGESLTLWLRDRDAARVDRFLAVREERGRLVPAKSLRARLGPPERGGRRLDLVVAADAAPGRLRLDGVRGRRPVVVLPLDIRIVPASARRKAAWPTPADARQSSAGRGTRKQASARMQQSRKTARSSQASALPAASRGERVSLARIFGDARIPVDRDVLRGDLLPDGVRVLAFGSIDGLVAASSAPSDGSSGSSPPQETETLPWFDGFEAASDALSWERAYRLSLLSWVAYFPEARGRAVLESWGLETGPGSFFDDAVLGFPWPGHSGSTQGFVAWNDDAIFVAIQGSTSQDLYQDWVDNDLDLRPFPIPAWGPTVVMHRGFVEAASVTFVRIRNAILSLRKARPGRRIWVTGHSLGGAVAKIIAFRLEHEAGVPVQGVYTYGAPPVGNNSWKAAYEARIANTHRWNLQNDPIVGLMPPPVFAHVGANHNLYDGASHGDPDHGWYDGSQLFYPPSVGFVGHLMGTHMAYWCRLHTEVRLHAPQRPVPDPPENVTPGCMTE